MKILPRLICGISLSMLVACAPRGETKTLNEVYLNAKQGFSEVSSVTLPANITQSLGGLSQRLEQIANQNGATAATTAGEVAGLLEPLVAHAGYASRPSLGELTTQFRSLATSQSVTTAQAKLLAARTYTLLTSELRTTKFSL